MVDQISKWHHGLPGAKFCENEVKHKRDDTEHYAELSKMREHRLAMDANEIKVPTLIILGMSKPFLKRMPYLSMNRSF